MHQVTIRSEDETLRVKRDFGDGWIIALNSRGHFVVAHKNPHTKKWDSLEWNTDMAGAKRSLLHRLSSWRDRRASAVMSRVQKERDPHKSRKHRASKLAPALRAKVSKKIQLLRREGYKAKQAAAIAYRKVLSSKKRRRDPDETHEEKLARWERQEHAERSRYPRHPTRHHQRQRVHLTVERMRLDRGGYEKSGRYWGTGEPLYRVSGELRKGERLYFIDLHVRARSAQEARAKVAEEERVVGVSRAAHARASRDPKRGRHRKGAYRRGR